MSSPEVNPRSVIGIIIALLVVISATTAFYTVPAESRGVVLRFGKKNKVVEPGLRFKIPFGVDRVSVVAVRRQQKQEFGFGTQGATNRTQYSSRNVQAEERDMITGDRNEASVEWIVQYRINDPEDFLFEVRNPEDTLRDVSESVMREVVGDRTVDEVLTIGRQEIESEVLLKMQSLVDAYGMGLGIDQVQLKNVNPPDKVQSSFNDVNQAQQEREKLINIARGEYNKEVPLSRGTADQLISQAHGYATKRINEAQGDAQRFTALFQEYSKAPEVTKRRIYLETLGEVIPNLGSKVILDDGAKQVLPLLQLPGLSK